MLSHFKRSSFALIGVMLIALPLPAQDKDAKHGNFIRSAKSGAWSAAAKWEGGKVPAAGARVQIREGHIVLYDAKSADVIRFIHVAGTLSFAPNMDTVLNVGLIKIQAGDDATENGFDCDAHAMPEGPDAPRADASRLAKNRPALEVGTPANPIGAKHTALIRLHFIEGTDKTS